MSKPKKNKLIKPLEGYTVMSDDDIASRGTAVETGLTGNSHFPTPPVDLATLKATIESFRQLISDALDGSKKVIAQKNKQRERSRPDHRDPGHSTARVCRAPAL